jgi:hypothetical protein
MDTHQARTEAIQEEIIAKMETYQGRMEANINAWQNKMKACPERTESSTETGQEPVEDEIKTCLVEVEATDLRANPKEKETVAEEQEVPKEEVTVKTVRALKKRYGNRQLQKRTQGIGGPQKKLATRRGMTHRAGVARHKGRSLTGPMVEQR